MSQFSFSHLVSVHNTETFTDQVYAPALFGFDSAASAQTFFKEAQAAALALVGTHTIHVQQVDLSDLAVLNDLLAATERAEADDPRLYEEAEPLLSVTELQEALAQHVMSGHLKGGGRLAALDAAFLLNDDGTLIDPDHFDEEGP